MRRSSFESHSKVHTLMHRPSQTYAPWERAPEGAWLERALVPAEHVAFSRVLVLLCFPRWSAQSTRSDMASPVLMSAPPFPGNMPHRPCVASCLPAGNLSLGVAVHQFSRHRHRPCRHYLPTPTVPRRPDRPPHRRVHRYGGRQVVWRCMWLVGSASQGTSAGCPTSRAWCVVLALPRRVCWRCG